MRDVARTYIDRGWTAPLPLPANEKYPPPSGFTGGITEISLDRIEKVWENSSDDSNVALRLQTDRDDEVISIDIDHYGNKRGMDHIKDLESQIGSLDLPNVPRSTRRGMDSVSAQYFFRVPKGKKWNSSVCADVDVVQLTHRYAAVYPSKIDGEQYRWYKGMSAIDIPSVDDLPELPERWVKYLAKERLGKLSNKPRKALSSRTRGGQMREAVQFLRKNIAKFDMDEDERLSPAMELACRSEEFQSKLSANAHDSMVAAIHNCVMLGVEGHVGLKVALRDIKNLFIREVTLRNDSTRRSEEQAAEEYRSAVISEVEKLMTDVEEGNVRLIEIPENFFVPDIALGLNPSEEAAKRPLGVEVAKYTNTDRGHAYMFFDYWGLDVLATHAGGDSQFATWNPKTGRYTFRGEKEMFNFIEHAISLPLEYEAGLIEKRIEVLNEKASQGPLGSEEDDPEQLEGLVNNLRKRANMMRNTTPARHVLSQLHSIPEIAFDITDFDSVPNIIGDSNARTLDLKTLLMFDEETDPTRPSKQVDRLTMSTAVSIQNGATHPVWQEFLDKFIPDRELQRFAQKVFGYTLIDHNPAKLVIFLWGKSNTGKTTILEAIGTALGDYAGPMNAAKLLGKSNGGPNPEIINSMHKRMVWLSEVGDGHQLSSNTIKQISGNDKQQARLNHSNHMVDAIPMFTPFISTNNPPNISQADEALRRRILVLPFNEAHEPTHISDKNDLKKNPEIQTAILWWIIEGCKLYLREGLSRKDWPKEVIRKSNEFISGVSEFQTFRTSHVVEDPEAKMLFDDVYKAYKTWCMQEGMSDRDIPEKRALASQFKNNGFQVKRTSLGGKKNVLVAFGFTLEM